MDAHKALITNIFNNSTLVEVPFFQRSYVWKEDLWGRLLEDMEFVVKTKKPHFLGSIILKEGRKPRQGENFADCRTIVDGQQRLTTFLIFMKVLCLKLGQTALFDCQFRIMGQMIALRHGRNDIQAFEKVMTLSKAEIIDNPEPASRIIGAFNYFVEHIDESKLDIMTIFVNTQFVRIDLDADEDEQQIFDTINSLGVNLTTSELLKNYFFNRETVGEYERKWADVFEKDDETKVYWDTFTQITWFVITEFIIILFGDIPPLSMIEGAFLKYFGIPVALTWFMSQKTFDGKKPYSFLKSQITYALRPKITYAGKAVKLHKQTLNETITAVRSVNYVPDKIY